MSWVAEYIGKPFAEGGRGPDAYDCWGLVRAVYAARLRLDLPLHDEIGTHEHARVSRAMQDAQRAGPWRRVARPDIYDVMVARRDAHGRYPGHVGVMLDGARVLHVWAGRDVHISRTKEPAVAGVLMGFYRHEAAP